MALPRLGLTIIKHFYLLVLKFALKLKKDDGFCGK
jgi:hypothetical protein